MLFLSGAIGAALGIRRSKHDGLIVRGAGMDMGYHVVSQLAYALHGSENSLKHQWL